MTNRKRPEQSEAMEDYLKTIYQIADEEGEGVKPGFIAKRLNVHKSTVTIALRNLETQGLINYSPYQEIHLTVKGFKHAEDIMKRHAVVYNFLKNTLKIENELAEQTACRLEHILPNEIIQRLEEHVNLHVTDTA